MTKFPLFAFFALAALASAALAQTSPTPTATPTPSATATPAAEDNDVVKISTSLIQLDVTVTDASDRIVRDLRPEDFEVYENGKKQKISGFSFVSNVSDKTVAEKPKPVDGTPLPPATQVRPEDVRRTVALVVDDLSLSFESAYQVRRALKKFVDEQMRDGDIVAIIRTGAGIGALQQFTSDKRILYAAIEKVVWNPLGGGGIGAFAPIDDTPTVVEESEDQKAARENFENAFEDFQSATFATGTLGALRYVVTGMSELPGRKSVVLFSDGFSLVERDESGNVVTSRIVDFLRQIIDLANRNSVVFYTLDARGLQVGGITAADNVSADPARIQQVLQQRSAQITDNQDGLKFLARETGGFAIVNNNDLAGGVRRVIDDQSYYLLAYEPDSDTFDPAKRKYNKLEIKVRGRSGLTVRYRSGFFNVAERRAAVSPKGATPADQLTYALTSPFGVNDISLRLNTLFGNSKEGSFVRALVHIDAGDLKFVDEPDGTKKAQFQIIAVTFGDNGNPVDQETQGYTARVGKDDLDFLRRNGFVYDLVLPVKVPGAYQFRVAIRDSLEGKLGSASQFIEVPNLKKKRLSLSGIVLQDLTQKQFQQFDSGKPIEPDADGTRPSSMTDTSLRRFPRGTVLRYGFDVYNALLNPSNQPQLTVRVRVFREGKLVFEGKPQDVPPVGQPDPERAKAFGAVVIAKQMDPGEYIMQVIVTDALAKQKRNIATQFVQFEVLPEVKQ